MQFRTMAGSFDDKCAIDKLDGSNWETWKFQIRHVLLAKGLWKSVDGTDSVSEEDQVVALLGSLPRSYATIVTALETRNGGVSLSYVQQALSHEEEKLKTCFGGVKAAGGGNGSALMVKERKLRCSGCKQFGDKHYEYPCEPGNHHAAKTVFGGDSGDDAAKLLCEASVGSALVSCVWIVDSEALYHMTPEKELLRDCGAFEQPDMVRLGYGNMLEAMGTGEVCLEMLLDGKKPRIATLRNVRYVPKLNCNLLSEKSAVSMSNQLEFDGKECWISDRSRGMRNFCVME